MRVLVVEDDPGIAAGLRQRLEKLGWAVDLAAGVESAWAALRAEAFDMVLLDLGLADGDGGTVLRRLRSAPGGAPPDPRTPVLILTARDQPRERIEGLDLGADDYLGKPFDVDELAARMRALQRRASGRASPGITHGRIHLDPASLQTRLDGEPVELSPREFALLLALLEASPRVLSRSQLEARLYNWDKLLESNAIEVHVHHIRRKLGAELIRTVRGVGYFVPREPT